MDLNALNNNLSLQLNKKIGVSPVLKVPILTGIIIPVVHVQLILP
jgi:hypothetical protein